VDENGELVWRPCLFACKDQVRTRVARRLQNKIPIWVYFGVPWNGEWWYILWSIGIFYGNLVYFTAIWYMLGSFTKYFFSPFLYFVPRKSGNPGADMTT
jgi:hypothetical protein